MIKTFTWFVLVCAAVSIAGAQPYDQVYLSYVGGSSRDIVTRAVRASNGDVFAVGTTSSSNFSATTGNSYQQTFGGVSDVFVTRYSSDGSIVASTYLGGTSADTAMDIAVLPNGDVVVAMHSWSSEFPATTTIGSEDASSRTVFVRLSQDLSLLGAALHFRLEHTIKSVRVAALIDGSIGFVGVTKDEKLPVTPSAMQDSNAGDEDGVIGVLNAALTSVMYLSYFGDDHDDAATAICPKSDGTFFVIGHVDQDDDETDIRAVHFSAVFGVMKDTTYVLASPQFIVQACATNSGILAVVKTPSSLTLQELTVGGLIQSTTSLSGIIDVVNDITSIDATTVQLSGTRAGEAIVTQRKTADLSDLLTVVVAGSGNDYAIGAWNSGSTVLTLGGTSSLDLPTTSNAAQKASTDAPGVVNDGWVAVFGPNPIPKTVLLATPSSVEFDSVDVGTTDIDTLVISLLSGPATTINSVNSALTPSAFSVDALTPAIVNQTTVFRIPVRFSPQLPGVAQATIRIITTDTVISIEVRGTGRDTTKPPPPPKKAVVTLQSIDVSNVYLGDSLRYTLALRIDSVAALEIDSAVITTSRGSLVTITRFPLLPMIPDDSVVVSIIPMNEGADSAHVSVYYPDSVATASIIWFASRPPLPIVRARVDAPLPAECGTTSIGRLVFFNVGSGIAQITQLVNLTSEAAIVLGMPALPHLIASGDSTVLEIQFSPLVPGTFTARYLIIADDDSMNVEVACSGWVPNPIITCAAIVFDSVLADSTTDTVLTIVNKSIIPLPIDSIRISGSPWVSISTSQTSFTIPPLGSWNLAASITPSDTGAFVSTVVIAPSFGSPIQTTISGTAYRDSVIVGPPPDTALRISFAIGSAEVSVGTTFSVGITSDEGRARAYNRGLLGMRFRLTYRRSLLTMPVPRAMGFDSGVWRSVDFDLTWNGSTDSVAALTFTACLGDAESTVVTLSDIVLVFANHITPMDTLVTGTIRVIDSWSPTNPRTVARDSMMPAVEVFPNPTIGTTTLSLHSCTPGARVDIYSNDGILVYSWTPPTADLAGDVHVLLPSVLPPGAYVCAFRSNNVIARRAFVVLR